MFTDYICIVCNEEIWLDETEGLWGCECISVATIPDEDFLPVLEYLPDTWREKDDDE